MNKGRGASHTNRPESDNRKAFHVSLFARIIALSSAFAILGAGTSVAQQPAAPGAELGEVKISLGELCPYEHIGYTAKTKDGVVRCVPIGGLTADVVAENEKGIEQWLGIDNYLKGKIPGKWELIAVLSPGSPFLAPTDRDLEYVPMDKLSECRLRAASSTNVGLQWRPSNGRVPTRGPIKIILIPVSSSVEPNTYHGFGTWLDQLHPGGSGLNHLEYANILQRAQSYGKSWFEFSVFPGTIELDRSIVSYGIQRSNADWGAGFNQYMADVVTAADRLVDFSEYDAFIAMPPPETVGFSPAWARLPGAGVMADGVEMTNGTTLGDESLYSTQGEIIVHEFGHLSGLPDLYDFAPAIFRHTGSLSQMSNPYQFRGSSGYERWLMRWIDDQRVRCVKLKRKQSTDITFDALSEAALPAPNVKLQTLLAVIPTTDSTAVVLEYRSRRGLDSTLPSTGVHVYRIDANVGTMRGPLISHRDDPDSYRPAATPEDWGDIVSRGDSVETSITRSLLRPGDSLVVDGYKIEVPRRQRFFSNRPSVPAQRSGALEVSVTRVS